MEFRVLGPLEIWDRGGEIEIGGAKGRAVLALLVLHANEVVGKDRLLDELWGEMAPRTAAGSLHNHISRLRKVLGAEILVTRAWGYVLRIEREQVDLHHFERLARDAEPLPAKERSAKLAEALALWRGPALADLVFEPALAKEASRLEELRLAVLEARIDADLEIGRNAEIVGELEALITEHPHRERLRGQLILALYRDGRQAEALEVYRETRRLLADELGLEPGPALRELERAILRQDDSLAPTLPNTTGKALPEMGRRWLVYAALAGAGLLATGAAIAGSILARGGDSSSLTVPPNAVGAIDPSTNKVADVVPVGASPSGIAVGEGAVWVLSGKTISRVDLRTDKVRSLPAHGLLGAQVAAGLGAVWVVQSDGTLQRIDPLHNKLFDSIRVSPESDHPQAFRFGSVAIGPRGVWVSVSDENSTVARIDTRKDRVKATGYAGNTPSGIAVGEDAVWVTNWRGNDVTKLDPGTANSAMTAPIAVGSGPRAIAIGGGSVWTADSGSDRVTRIDPVRDATESIPVGKGPDAIAFGYGSIWVANGKGGTVSRIDPETGAVRTIKIGNYPVGIAVGGGRVWVSVQPPPPSPRQSTPEYFMAVRDGVASPDEALLAEYGRALDDLHAKCPDKREILMDMALSSAELLKTEKGLALSGLKVLSSVTQSIPDRFPGRSCAEVFAAFVDRAKRQ